MFLYTHTRNHVQRSLYLCFHTRSHFVVRIGTAAILFIWLGIQECVSLFYSLLWFPQISQPVCELVGTVISC